MDNEDLFDKIRSGEAVVGIIGLGYVGLPLALAFSKRYRTVGYDSNEDRVQLLCQGISDVDDAKTDDLLEKLSGNLKITMLPSALKDGDCIIVCVPTPLDERGIPDLSHVEESAKIIGSMLKKGMLVVLESTSYPGTTEEYFGKAIMDAGFVPGRDIALAFSPERIDPGNKNFNIINTPKIIGGIDVESTNIAAELYSSIIESEIVRVRDCATAEAVKMVENVFRGVNIALINELSLVFERMGINTWEVVKAASTKPFGFMPHYPGPGVGGHCIPLDPLYLSYKSRQYDFVPRFIELSREINEFMKDHTVNIAMDALRETGIDISDAVIGIMGLAYKKNISDTRESPARKIIEELSKKVKKILVFDPKVDLISTSRGIFTSSSWDAVVKEAHCLVFLTDHDEFIAKKMSDIHGPNLRVIIDTRNLFEGEEVEREGLVYRGIGKGNRSKISSASCISSIT